MSQFFNQSETLRSLVGAVAAVLLGGTVLLAAVGPAAVPQVQTAAAESNIVHG